MTEKIQNNGLSIFFDIRRYSLWNSNIGEIYMESVCIQEFILTIWQVFFLGQYETPSESRLGSPPKYEKRDFEGGNVRRRRKFWGLGARKTRF